MVAHALGVQVGVASTSAELWQCPRAGFSGEVASGQARAIMETGPLLGKRSAWELALVFYVGQSHQSWR